MEEERYGFARVHVDHDGYHPLPVLMKWLIEDMELPFKFVSKAIPSFSHCTCTLYVRAGLYPVPINFTVSETLSYIGYSLYVALPDEHPLTGAARSALRELYALYLEEFTIRFVNDSAKVAGYRVREGVPEDRVHLACPSEPPEQWGGEPCEAVIEAPLTAYARVLTKHIAALYRA